MSSRSSLVASLALALPLAVAAGCQSGAQAPPADDDRVELGGHAIVNGEVETGWPAVGALTLVFNNGYYGGSFCSGTVIDPSWILTAAHCVSGEDLQQQGIAPQTTRWLVGSDARPDGGAPGDGELYAVDAFVPHPSYNELSNANDIALVHLTEPLEGVTPRPFMVDSLQPLVDAAYDDNTSLPIFAVGFGATEGIQSSGSGLKRSTTVALDHLQHDEFVSNFAGSGTCFGDSGGPGFADYDGTPHVAGVTSAGYGCSPLNPHCDPCQTSTVYTRVDAYADWIQGVIDGGDPTCLTVPSMCLCADACLEDGTCDNTVCHIADCRDTYDCYYACADDDDACRDACIDFGTPEAQETVAPLIACADEACADAGATGGQQHRRCVREECSLLYNACTGFGPTESGDQDCALVYDCMTVCETWDCTTECQNHGTLEAQAQVSALTRCLRQQCRNEPTDEAYQACAREKCGDEIDQCFPDVFGEGTCAEITQCLPTCDGTAPSCRRDCVDAGTAEAQAAYTALRDCATERCDDAADRDACTLESCAAETLACVPDVEIGAGCDLAGGGCPDGTACVGTDEGTACAPTAGRVTGDACDPSATPRDCADGLECRVAPETSGGVCGPPCVDDDGDGFCADEECDDSADTIHPGAAEICGDGLDQDCDAIIDGGCEEVPEGGEPVVAKKSDSGCAGGGGTGALALFASLALLAVRRRERFTR